MEKFSTNIGEIIADKHIDTREIQQLKEKYNITEQTITSLSRQSWIELFETIKKQEGIQNIYDLQNIVGVKADTKFGKNSWENLTEIASEYDNQRISIGEIIQNNQINLEKLDTFLAHHNISYTYIQTQNFDTMRNLLMKIKKNEGTHIVKKLQKMLGFESKDIDGEIGRNTWKALLGYQKKYSKNSNIEHTQKNIKKKSSWGNFASGKNAGLWSKKGEIRVIPGYDINKVLGKTVISNHRAEISYFQPEEHSEEKEHNKNPLFDIQNNVQNHDQFHISGNISQNIFGIQNPFDVNKLHNHDILSFAHSHDTISWNDYHNGFDYTVDPLHQNISYTQQNKKFGGQIYQHHDTKISQFYASNMQNKQDSIQNYSLNLGTIDHENDKNIFSNFSWQQNNFSDKNENTQNNIHYGGNIFLQSDRQNMYSGNIGIAKKQSWENKNFDTDFIISSNLNALYSEKLQFSANIFLQSNISYQLKSFSCNSNIEYSIWQHAQNLGIHNNCYNSQHSFGNSYEKYSADGEKHTQFGLFYGYKIHPDHVIRVTSQTKNNDNYIGITYKFQY